MFNLLKDSLKAKIKTEYNLRRVIVGLVFILFLQVIFLIFLFPSWLISVYKENDYVSRTEETKHSELSTNTQPIVSNITSINTKLKSINSGLIYPAVEPLLRAVVVNKSASIHVGRFSYTSSGPTTSDVTLSGVSATRESLVDFVKSLQSSGLFKSVDLPISNLAKDKDIDFSINITIDTKTDNNHV